MFDFFSLQSRWAQVSARSYGLELKMKSVENIPVILRSGHQPKEVFFQGCSIFEERQTNEESPVLCLTTGYANSQGSINYFSPFHP
jgi:hypothetical protein